MSFSDEYWWWPRKKATETSFQFDVDEGVAAAKNGSETRELCWPVVVNLLTRSDVERRGRCAPPIGDVPMR